MATDMLQTNQALHDRGNIEETAANIFTRRAMWDGAVIAYCRCYKTGRRRALLKQLLDELTPPERARHDETIRWRDRHIAHRVDPDLETAAAIATLDAAGRLLKIEGRVTTSTYPPEQEVAELAGLVTLLKDRVWETRLVPLENKLRTEYQQPST